MKFFKSICLVVFLFVLFTSLSADEYISPFFKIDQAVANGDIDAYDAAILKAGLIFNSQPLPKEYQVENPRVKSLTPFIIQIERVIATAPKSVQDQYAKMQNRPTFSGPHEVYITPEYEFYVHFTREGIDRPLDLTDSNDSGWPDYIENIGAALDYSFHVNHNEIGYITPPGDGTLGGGMDNYDFYIKNLAGTGAAGYCRPETQSNDVPEFPSRRTSHCVLSRNLDAVALTSTTTHEYAHMVQFGMYYDINYDSTSAWMENHAMYSQEVVFPDDNDWVWYVGPRQNRPYLALWTFYSPSFPSDSGFFPYGNVIWPFFLNEYIAGFDEGLVKEVNVRIGHLTLTPWQGGHYRQAVADTIHTWSGGSYDLASAYNVFTNWNYLVATLWDGSGYSQGDIFPRSTRLHHQVNATTDIPFHGDGAPVNVNDAWPQSFGSHYNVIDNTHNTQYNSLKIEFEGTVTNESAWGYSVLVHEKDAPWNDRWSLYAIENLDEEPFTDTIFIDNIQNYNRILFIVDNTRNVEGVAGRNYNYWVTFAGPDASINSTDIGFSPPNPMPGDEVTLYARVYNTCIEPVNSGTINFYYAEEYGTNHQLIDSQSFGSIEPDGYLDFTASWDTSGLNEMPYVIIVDLQDIQPYDVNPYNNTAVIEIQLPVELASFSALGLGETVNLRWQTLSEVDNLGFNIYRLSAGKVSPFMSFLPVRINESIIQGQGTSHTPHSYRFKDRVDNGSDHIYILESVSIYGETEEWRTRLNWVN